MTPPRGTSDIGPAEFLRLLWTARPPGLVCLWQLEKRLSAYIQSPHGAAGLGGRTDIYCGVATTRSDRGRHRRMKAHESAAIAGLWLDVDVNGGPDAKTGVAPDLDAAIALADTILAPTMIVGSGYGIHAWWLLDRPWAFRTVEERDQAALASAQWFALHRAAAARQGFSVDHAHDLARVMRLPGTLNGKPDGNGKAPAEVLHYPADARRYDRATLLDLAATAGPVGLAARPDEAESADVTPRPGAAPPRQRFEALLANSEDFAATWRHDRPDRPDWSASEYDLALCSLAAQASWTDQQLADLIAYHRATCTYSKCKTSRARDPEKAHRKKYIDLTIGRARDSQLQRAALDDMGRLVGRLRGVAA